MEINILLVDDSAFMRQILKEKISEIDGLNVVATARNSQEAFQKIKQFNPDLITLDIEMPGMNGLETLKVIKESYDIPVMMMSSLSGKEITIEALEAGAIDFIEKPADIKNQGESFKKQIEFVMKQFFNRTQEMTAPRSNDEGSNPNKSRPNAVRALAIGASTGGPRALLQVMKDLPEGINVPIFIVQHMPKGFTASFAQRMDAVSPVKVVEAYDGMPVEGGKAYVAPGDHHMTVKNRRIQLSQTDKIHGVRPAVDHLFSSAAESYGSRLIGVVLTGMGKDGTEGLKKIKTNGGYTFAQDKESSLVFGMPGNAIQNKVIDEVVNLEELTDALNQVLGGRK
ncbi:chemotaxis response regulator protein-glutamate methylesterase [Trichococcus sp. K1Tr]|uniref:protein-glutamate methylesterase/protein-glutamine glutaminase n=1 Tax=Trichococcus sp. K1Tr TaxID=3020847 RepID=UPI00232E6482|nr:chemotaxis response regulator protein-glutamate methylesterase [Trichococcus sp. K1Tr]MDB6353441.1 chemotaxis response regulator protein-glutamate methylesterase [Trichococcus sp. K1Tr]